MIIATLLGAFFFAAAGVVGALLGVTFAERVQSLPDGPPPQNVPVPLLVLGCALIGAFITTHAFLPTQLVVLAIVCLALVAIWIVDARRGVVPDIFTLGPLAIILLVALWQHEWWYLVGAAVPFVPFAAAAALSKGRGMGWGDVKLVALGGAVLGVEWGILACMAACLAVFIVSCVRRQRRGPIAFAPYLTAAIGAAIPLIAVMR